MRYQGSYALSDVAVIMDEYDLSAVVFNELAAFFAHGIRHYDDRLVAPYSADECQTDTLIPACRFDDDSIFIYPAFFFGIFYHIESCSGLDRSADVKTFKLYKYFRIAFFVYAVKPYHRCMTDCFKYIIIYHCEILRF